MPQPFKGDELELKISGAARVVMAQLFADLTNWFNQAYNSTGLGAILYDNNLTPLTKSIARDIFIKNYGEILRRWEYLGSFDSYYYVLQQVFGAETEITFAKLAPGALKINLIVKQVAFFKFLARIGDGAFVGTHEGQNLYFKAAEGITHFYEVQGLLESLTPAGIYLEVDFRLQQGV